MSNPFKDDWKMRSDYLYAKRKQDMRRLNPLLIKWLEEYREKNAPNARKSLTSEEPHVTIRTVKEQH
jgi:hypothetical protein